MEPILEPAAWREPLVVVAVGAAVIPFVSAGITIRGSRQQESRMDAQLKQIDQELSRLRLADESEWKDRFVEYRKNMKLLADSIRAAYAAFRKDKMHDQWESLIDEADWPAGLPRSQREPLNKWKTNYKDRLNSQSQIALCFAESIYSDDSLLLSKKQIAIIEKFHNEVANYFDWCGDMAGNSADFQERIDRRVAPSHFRNLKLVVYLELALAQMLNNQPQGGKLGMFELGERWNVLLSESSACSVGYPTLAPSCGVLS